MVHTKLEAYMAVAKILAQNGPLKLKQIQTTMKLDRSTLKEYLRFLVEQGIVEEKFLGKTRTAFVTTVRGTKILKYFGVTFSVETNPDSVYR